MIDNLEQSLYQKLEDAYEEECEIPSTLNNYFMETVNKMILEDHKSAIMKVANKFQTTKYEADHKTSCTVMNCSAEHFADVASSAILESIGDSSNEMQEAKLMDAYLHAYWLIVFKNYNNHVF